MINKFVPKLELKKQTTKAKKKQNKKKNKERGCYFTSGVDLISKKIFFFVF